MDNPISFQYEFLARICGDIRTRCVLCTQSSALLNSGDAVMSFVFNLISCHVLLNMSTSATVSKFHLLDFN